MKFLFVYIVTCKYKNGRQDIEKWAIWPNFKNQGVEQDLTKESFEDTIETSEKNWTNWTTSQVRP